MIIRYAHEHSWFKPITDDPLTELGKNNKARIKSTLNKIEDTTIRYTIEPLTEATLDWFTPLYTAAISSKQNPKLFDLYSTTLGKESAYTYYALSLYEDDQPIGATIFSERRTMLSIAYRAYPNDWSNHSLQAKPSLYTEYLINLYAHERGYTKLSHGRDRNPYGINSHIGLAMFKLSVGCNAKVPAKEHPISEVELDSFTEDVLIMLHPENGRDITDAILYVVPENLSRYQQVLKYPDHLNVSVIERSENS